MKTTWVKQITTNASWNSLAADSDVMLSLKDICQWLTKGKLSTDKEQITKPDKAGLPVLLNGDAIAQKILAAALIGKETSKPVYMVELSKLVSKYIGETEKNLSKLFADATSKEWILFFDEADALFGKRTDVKDAHDRYSNAETNLILQNIESYNGLVLLASNMKTNIDNAFTRRLRYILTLNTPSQIKK